MNDAKGRPIDVGDWIATAAEDGAILGQVEEVNDELVHLGDGVTYEGSEIITLDGWMWYICLDCNSPSPVDARGKAIATCSLCGSTRMLVDGKVSPHTAAELGL